MWGRVTIHSLRYSNPKKVEKSSMVRRPRGQKAAEVTAKDDSVPKAKRPRVQRGQNGAKNAKVTDQLRVERFFSSLEALKSGAARTLDEGYLHITQEFLDLSAINQGKIVEELCLKVVKNDQEVESKMTEATYDRDLRLTAMRMENERLREAAKTAKKQAEDVEHKMNASQEKVIWLESANKRSMAQISQLRMVNERISKSNDLQSKEMADMKHLQECNVKGHSEMRKQLDNLADAYFVHSGVEHCLEGGDKLSDEAVVDFVSALLAERQESKNKVSTEMKTCMSKLQALQRQLRELKAKHFAQDFLIQEREKEIKTKTKRLSLFKSNLKCKDETIEKVKCELEFVKKKLASVNDAEQEGKHELDVAIKANEKLQRQVQMVTTVASNVAKELEDVRREHAKKMANRSNEIRKWRESAAKSHSDLVLWTQREQEKSNANKEAFDKALALQQAKHDKALALQQAKHDQALALQQAKLKQEMGKILAENQLKLLMPRQSAATATVVKTEPQDMKNPPHIIVSSYQSLA